MVAAALQGNWRDEQLFALKQALALIDVYATQITECDAKLQQLLGAVNEHELLQVGSQKTPAFTLSRPFSLRFRLLDVAGSPQSQRLTFYKSTSYAKTNQMVDF